VRIGEIAGLALRHTGNTIAEEICLRTGLDFTRPVAIHAILADAELPPGNEHRGMAESASTLAAEPMNVNISIDSHRSEVHDYSRGIAGSLDRILQGIANVIAARKAAGLDFPIVIKAVVHRLNFRDLPKMVGWIQEIGASAINFQPVDWWSPETYDELWIDAPEDLADLRAVRDELIGMKRAGAPIMNSELLLQAWDRHFLSLPAPDEYRPYRVGIKNYFIRPDGDVGVCWYYKPTGNVRTANAREIWYGAEATERRKETAACDSLCLFTCLSQKPLVDTVKMGLVPIRQSEATREHP
jgi:MoaA/NifB/PqqE/SkfB family radical SAM enzyme